MWIKFWAQYHLRSGEKEETHYFWAHDDDGTNWDGECIEWAKETSTGQAQWYDGGGHSFEYEAFKLDRLPDDVRAQMIKEYEDRVLNAQKMLDILKEDGD